MAIFNFPRAVYADLAIRSRRAIQHAGSKDDRDSGRSCENRAFGFYSSRNSRVRPARARLRQAELERDEEGETRPIGIIPTSHRDLCRLWDYAGISRQSLFSVVLHEIRDKAESQAAFLLDRGDLRDSLGISSPTTTMYVYIPAESSANSAYLSLFVFDVNVRFPSRFQRVNSLPIASFQLRSVTRWLKEIISRIPLLILPLKIRWKRDEPPPRPSPPRDIVRDTRG